MGAIPMLYNGEYLLAVWAVGRRAGPGHWLGSRSRADSQTQGDGSGWITWCAPPGCSCRRDSRLRLGLADWDRWTEWDRAGRNETEPAGMRQSRPKWDRAGRNETEPDMEWDRDGRTEMDAMRLGWPEWDWAGQNETEPARMRLSWAEWDWEGVQKLQM